ncbi:globin [Colletotrichum graminicola]|uniref:nitric oxide dioxygenase n=1 Tax=Colletotrichum graminicola (strain M1.001 / M2 / FGSC 10212) TaxID=645133 RepID=E3QS00_COLGM|nr:globin [Colletotrichum graminicola M1.001]EFQ33638.1 globin [Colletotrichum graminicola M1.001]WDK10788.1 globin [Colletotrichum graminicola]
MALTYKQSQLVRGTIPALREHGETITSIFYANMLRAHPELHDYFNKVNQANGRQPRALTGVILTFASNLNNISELIPKLERMCNKHCSLGIQPEQYDIVGKYLIQAFGQVLGPTMTPETREAWTKAYSILAKMLISREAQMYREFDQDKWTGWRKFRIERKVAETDDIFSFYLVPVDGKQLPDFYPGQYTSIRANIPALGHLQSRQYSLSDAPRPDYYRITVKRDQGVKVGKGSAVIDLNPGVFSNYLINDKKPGDLVELTHPTGDFFFDTHAAGTQPVVLISAGVGATPLMSICNTIIDRQAVRPISWVHCSARAAPFEDHIRRIASKRISFSNKFFRSQIADVLDDDSMSSSSDLGLRMDLTRIDPAELYIGHGGAEYYICGPEIFMTEMSQYLIDQGVDSARVKFERFTTGDLEFKH